MSFATYQLYMRYVKVVKNFSTLMLKKYINIFVGIENLNDNFVLKSSPIIRKCQDSWQFIPLIYLAHFMYHVG